MILTRNQKQSKINQIKNSLKDFAAVVSLNYKEFPVSEIERLRDICFEKGDKVLFVKNSLVKLSMQENMNNLEYKGSSCLIFSNNVFQLLKTINGFVLSLKEYPNTELVTSGGIVENSVASKEMIKLLSSIDSKELIYANLIKSLFFPLSGLVKILNAPMLDMCKILDYQVKNC